jgi:hypothetical protein
VYAGAAREAVFSNPEVIRRINADFVPLALRASLVNGAQQMRYSDERWIYERVHRAKLAPQGIAVLDAAGQVLDWVQMFDSNRDVLDFLDHARKRFQDNAGAKSPAVTERYMKFPSLKVDDFQDKARLRAVAARHGKGKVCPGKHAKGSVAAGDLVAHLVGRALDNKGRPLADVVNQEHYVEDKFIVAARMQETIAEALGKAKDRVQLPEAFARMCATHAHLGHIDVQPCLCMVPGKILNKGEWKRCELWAKREPAGAGTTLWRIDGRSEVVSELAVNGNGVHNVNLTWTGFITMNGNRMSGLLLSARGQETLEFSNNDHPLKKVKKDEVAFLPAGRPIEVDTGVRYGIIAEPAAVEDTVAEEPLAQQIPDEARKPLVEVLGAPFRVFRDPVHEELKLSDEQRQKLLDKLPAFVQATMKVFEEIKELEPPQREKKMQEHRQKAGQNLSEFLKDLLDGKQQKRLFQLQLQQAGAFALLGENEAFLILKITAEQRKKFMELVQEMHKKIQLLSKEAETGGNPEDIRSRVMTTQRDYRARVEAVLTDSQRSQWRKLLGKPFKLDG